MLRYKVTVYGQVTTSVEVDAESADEAVKKAEQSTLYGYHRWSDCPQIFHGKGVVQSYGKIGEPLINIPETWEIYSTDEYEKIAKTANAEITAAVRMVCADIVMKSKSGKTVDAAYCQKLYSKHITPVFKKYEKLGTGDTEPRANVANIVSKFAAWAGADGDDVYEALRYHH